MPANWFSLRRFFDFRGRASRREYFLFHLIAIALILLPIFAMVPFLPPEGTVAANESAPLSIPLVVLGTLYTVAQLAAVIAIFAVAVRRLHDQGKTWWHMLFGFIPLIGWIITLVWIFTPGDEGENEFGPDLRDGETGRPSYDGVFD